MSNWKNILTTTTIKTTETELIAANQIKKSSWEKELEILRNRNNIAWADTFKNLAECFNYIKTDDYLKDVSIKNMQLYKITDRDEILLIVY